MMTQNSSARTRVHISLNVNNLADAVAFYQAFLGCAPLKQRPGYANFALDEPPLKLALNEFPVAAGAAHPGPLSHLGFQVDNSAAVDAARSRLQAAGLATFDETDTTCCYAQQDKIWVHDPDGNAWEIYVVTDEREDDLEHDHAGNQLIAGSLLPNPALSVLQPSRQPGGPTCCR